MVCMVWKLSLSEVSETLELGIIGRGRWRVRNDGRQGANLNRHNGL